MAGEHCPHEQSSLIRVEWQVLAGGCNKNTLISKLGVDLAVLPELLYRDE
jgi:hypothetical protein